MNTPGKQGMRGSRGLRGVEGPQGWRGRRGRRGRQGTAGIRGRGFNARENWYRDLITLIIAGLVAWSLLGQQSFERSTRGGLEGQTKNRAKNVAVWCNAINGLEHDLKAYVAQFPHVPKLRVTALDCQSLEGKTLLSAKPR